MYTYVTIVWRLCSYHSHQRLTYCIYSTDTTLDHMILSHILMHFLDDQWNTASYSFFESMSKYATKISWPLWLALASGLDNHNDNARNWELKDVFQFADIKMSACLSRKCMVKTHLNSPILSLSLLIIKPTYAVWMS